MKTVTTLRPARPTARREGDDPPTSHPTAPVSIVIPTLNEADNVAPLLASIEESMPAGQAEVIFVDDSSDNTPDVVRDASLRSALSIRLIHRSPELREGGLSGAVLMGCRQASRPWTCVMDADLQHSPAVIPLMIDAAETSHADVVVASRYIPGGSAAGLGGWGRRLISHGSRWLAKGLFPERLWGIADPCGGFFIVKTDLMRSRELRPIGFKILLEVLMRTDVQTVVEVPYRFEGRAGGQSKATFRQGTTFLRHLLRLWREVPGAGRYSKFALVGGSGVLVNLGLLLIGSTVLGLNQWPAWLIGVEGSILWNYLLNRQITWADRSRESGLFSGMGAYQAVATTAVGLNALVFALLTAMGTNTILAGLAGIMGAVAINFAGADKYVFSRLFSTVTDHVTSAAESVADGQPATEAATED